MLIQTLKKFYKEYGRSHLPWRQTTDPYAILVSEMMLQQTQVDRVISKYHTFIRAFPTVQDLARASLKEVLAQWIGLGYNRRAKFLHEAAKVVVEEREGKFPKDVIDLEKLPGVGPYTARALAAFAYNQPVAFVETNIRTVFFYTTTSKQMGNDTLISDKELLPRVARVLKRSKMEPRDFYAALMDYGSFLKKSGVRVNSRSTHYTKQTKFAGSPRQLRGTILRELLTAPATAASLQKLSQRTIDMVERELANLVQEGLLTKKSSKYEVFN